MEVNMNDAEGVRTAVVNASGQVYIGRDHEGKQVRVAFEVVDDEPENSPKNTATSN